MRGIANPCEVLPPTSEGPTVIIPTLNYIKIPTEAPFNADMKSITGKFILFMGIDSLDIALITKVFGMVLRRINTTPYHSYTNLVGFC